MTDAAVDGLRSRLRPIAGVVAATALLAFGARWFGFGSGLVVAVTPASGLAIAAAVFWRLPGVLAATAGFAIAGLLAGLGPMMAMTDALGHGAGAAAGAGSMLVLARRGINANQTQRALVFFVGVSVFTLVVATVVLAATIDGLQPPLPGILPPPALVMVFEPFGLLTFAAVALTARNLRTALADPGPTLGIVAVGLALTAMLAVVLRIPGASPSGAALLLSTPFCLWVAMQRRSADGAALSFVAGHAVVWLLHARTGSITAPDFVSAVLYLDLLVATCHLVHAVNLDRLGAMAAVKAHQQHLEERVAERTARLNAMTERAIEADAAKSRFLATVSHEVRTPLNGVIGMATVVLAGGLDDRTRGNVEMIRTSGLHLLEVINRILDFSKLDHQNDTGDVSVFDLPGLVEEVLAEARFSQYARGLTLRSEIEFGLARRRLGYRQGVRQILTNFVGNAAKFTEKGSVVVRVSSRGEDGALRIAVADTGIGVPPDRQARIFLPFEQGDGSMTRRFGGTGLGLAICAELAQRMDGQIGLESREGEGATFWIDLPLPQAEAPHLADSRISA